MELQAPLARQPSRRSADRSGVRYQGLSALLTTADEAMEGADHPLEFYTVPL